MFSIIKGEELILVVAASVGLVSGDDVSSLANLGADKLAGAADNLFPSTCDSVANIDCSGPVVNQERPKMPANTFPGCCKGSLILSEVNDVVNLDIGFNRAHSAPPSKFFVAMKAPKFLEPS